MKLIPFVICLVLSGLSSAAEETDSKIESAKTAVAALLKDPDSAKFQAVRTVKNSKGAVSIVGEVNARNSYGGYSGFTNFVVSDGYVALVNGGESYKRYRLAGGAGPEGELEARLEDEAQFNAEVVWALLSNVIVEGQTPAEAVEAALVAIKARAKSNGGEITDAQATLIRQQYQASIATTLKDKNQVKAIKADPAYQKAMFIPVLYASTLTQLKAQMGLK